MKMTTKLFTTGLNKESEKERLQKGCREFQDQERSLRGVAKTGNRSPLYQRKKKEFGL